MSYDENIKKAPKLIEHNSISILHECVSSLGKEVRPVGIDFVHLLTGISKTTGYRQAVNVDDVERHMANNLLLRIFKYQNERSTNNNSEEIKLLAKEIIIEASRLYSNISLNEMKPKVTQTKENKQNEET